MIYLKLFLTFFEIGAVCFGGGYGMISLIREKVLINGWLAEEELLNLIAVSESTPGPIAVNMATFIGSTQGGILGSLCATLGVVLPAFIIILLICILIRNLLKYSGVQAFLSGARPCVVGLIVATAIIMLLSTVFKIKTVFDTVNFDIRGAVIFIIIAVSAFLYKKWRKASPSPIMLVILSGVLGVIFYAIQ